MPGNLSKATRGAAKKNHSTVGRQAIAGQRTRQAAAPLDDPREQRFVERYVETNNGTQSAIVAGYSVKSARTIASQLLKRRNIKEAIEARNAQLMDELNFTPDRIIRELAKIAGVNSADFIRVGMDGRPYIDFSGVTRRHLAAVASVENTEKGVKYKTHDKLKALDMLAKMAGLYPAERHEHTGADGGPIGISVRDEHKIDIEALDPDQRAQLKRTLLMLTRQNESQVESE